jgi:hypothetical protein
MELFAIHPTRSVTDLPWLTGRFDDPVDNAGRPHTTVSVHTTCTYLQGTVQGIVHSF